MSESPSIPRGLTSAALQFANIGLEQASLHFKPIQNSLGTTFA
jgi:hypothetical protein